MDGSKKKEAKDPKHWSLNDGRGVMALFVVFGVLVFLLPELDKGSYDAWDARNRVWMAGLLPILATLNWGMMGPIRSDLLVRLGAIALLGVCALTLVDSGRGAFAAALVPMLALFVVADATDRTRMRRTLDGFAVVAAGNLAWPWLAEVGIMAGKPEPFDRALLSVGTIAAVGVMWLSGRAGGGLRHAVPASLAVVLSLLLWLQLDWSAVGSGLGLGAVMFAAPTLAVLWAQEEDRIAWKDSK